MFSTPLTGIWLAVLWRVSIHIKSARWHNFINIMHFWCTCIDRRSKQGLLEYLYETQFLPPNLALVHTLKRVYTHRNCSLSPPLPSLYLLLRDSTDRKTYLPEQRVKLYMYQLCKSIYHMHRNGIFHRDVKPENILVKVSVNQTVSLKQCPHPSPVPPTPFLCSFLLFLLSFPLLPSFLLFPSLPRTMCSSWQTLDHVKVSTPSSRTQSTSPQDGTFAFT